MQAFAFAAHYNHGVVGEFDGIVGGFAALVETVDEVAHVLERAQGLVDIGGANYRQMFKRPGRGFGHGFGESGGAAFRHYDRARSGRVRGANDGAEVMRIFHAIEHNDQRRMRGYVFEFRVLLFRAERDDALMGFDARETVHRAAIFKADRRASVAGEIDDFLHATAGQSARHEDAFEGALCAESFGYGVKTNENGQARLSRSRCTQCCFVLDGHIQAVIEAIGKIRQRDYQC